MQPHLSAAERLRPSTRGGGGRGFDCGKADGATDADGREARDIFTAINSFNDFDLEINYVVKLLLSAYPANY